MIIVAGIARSGLTATMQMLNAGGYPCIGKYPAFEYFSMGNIQWDICKGKAVKSVDTQLQIPPDGEYKIIQLSRDLKQQAKSTNKLMSMVFGLPPMPISGLIKSFKQDYRAINRWSMYHDVLRLNFEDIITDPTGSAYKIAKWVGPPLDIQKMADCIIAREPGCHPRLLELGMIES